MKKLLLLALVTGISLPYAFSQKNEKFYSESGGELIFSFADVTYNGQDLNNKLRFSFFLHMGQHIHYNFSSNMGIFSGYGLRNIGFITEQNNIITKRRTYALGVPLALKFGSFDDHFYFYGGGEYELFFHYKQKELVNGDKIKFSEWFSDRTERFVPSLFAGVQFPKGINLKFKLYPGHFINRGFTGTDFGRPVDYSDYTRSRLFYIALSFNMPTKKIREIYDPNVREAHFVGL
jgi:hypothetical protein